MKVRKITEKERLFSLKLDIKSRISYVSLKTLVKSCHHRSEKFIYELLASILQNRYCFIQALSLFFDQSWWNTLETLVKLGLDEIISYQKEKERKSIKFNWDKLREIVKQYATSKGAVIIPSTDGDGKPGEEFRIPNHSIYMELKTGADGEKTHYACRPTRFFPIMAI